MKSRLQNTSEAYNKSVWIDQQKALIASLQVQPLVIVLRIDPTGFKEPFNSQPWFSLIEELHSAGVEHIEIAWSSNASWMSLMQELKASFTDISLGAASITNIVALESVAELGLHYAMTPIWDIALQVKARKLKQLLIPGVSSTTAIQQAKCFGCQLFKLFPASTLGIKYIHHLKDRVSPSPFVIASGGLTVDDLNPWLQEGYGAIALGRGLLHNHKIDPQLRQWLETLKKTT